MSIVDENAISDASGNETIHDVVASRLSRRALIGGGVAGAAVLSGVGALGEAIPAQAGGRVARPATELGVTAIPPSSADTVVVPPGYTARVLIAWGDPVSDGPAFASNASNSAA